MTQKLICCHEQGLFEYEVNKALAAGYKAVPHTHCADAGFTPTAGENPNRKKPGYYGIVVEKEEEVTSV